MAKITSLAITMLLVWSVVAANALADVKIMECKRWVVEDNKRNFITKFLVRLDTISNKITIDEDLALKYPLTKKYGEWKTVWVSKNKLRVVAFAVGDDVELSHPISVFDFDFSKLRMRNETFGGITDFDTIVSRPKYECQRKD